MPVLNISIEVTDHPNIYFHFLDSSKRGEAAPASFVSVVGELAMKLFEESTSVSTWQQNRHIHGLYIMVERLSECVVDDPLFWRIFFERVDLIFESRHVSVQTTRQVDPFFLVIVNSLRFISRSCASLDAHSPGRHRGSIWSLYRPP